MDLIQIGRKDIFWNYSATFLKIAASVLLLPLILRMLSSEMVGIWSIFMTITAFANLLDFGFSPSFTTNVTYVFSGVTKLKTKGFENISTKKQPIDYGLLKGVIRSMRWLYLRMALILFLILATVGSYYIYSVLQNYSGDKQEVYIAWIILCLINTYNIYTLYYDSLLQGKGLVKRSKQIVIVGQTVYLVIASTLIMFGFGLIAIVSAQASSVLLVRWLSYRSFYTAEIKKFIQLAVPRSQKEVLKAIYPNALKIGLTSLGAFMVLRSAMVIGSLHLSLAEIASYGITMQLISVIASLASIYTTTYQPKIAQLRVGQNNKAIKELYLKGQLVLLLTFIAGGLGLILTGHWALNLIESKTQLLSASLIGIALLVSFLENNHSMAGNILLTKNEVPFFKASLVSGCISVTLLLLLFQFTNIGLLAMILAPGLAQLLYQNWKWPYEVYKELEITPGDISKAIQSFK
jgi:O-antigen/teichoic acid export membrane protein